MPRSAQYTVIWSDEKAAYLLASGTVDSVLKKEDWQGWLETHSSFAFQGRNGRINMLKEKRSRGEHDYWYAYQRHGKVMVKQYAGRSAQLSMAKLEEVTFALAEKDKTDNTYDASSHEDSRMATVETVETIETIEKPEQSEVLLMSKLQIPRLQTSLLKRERLMSMLDKSLEYSSTLLAAPAGYGKTTAITQWIAEQTSRADAPQIAYVILDESDNNPVRFWQYVIAACQKFRPGLGKEALDLLLENRLPPFKPLEMLLIALLNELSQLDATCVLVLDDFHVIRSSFVSESLSFLLEHLPTSFHVFLILRGDLPASLNRLRARDEMLDIAPPYLCFSEEETYAFLKQEFPFQLSEKNLRRIFQKVEGWPAGIRFFVNLSYFAESERTLEQILPTFLEIDWSIQVYFFNEVLYTLTEEQQRFLLETSILPRLNAALCDTVLEREDSAQQLKSLRAGDLFLQPFEPNGGWLRYQALFAEAMQQEARERLGEERLRTVATLASSWYERHGYSSEAIETALFARDYTHSMKLMQRYIESRQQSDALTIPEIYRLYAWFKSIPAEEVERNPYLCLHYALTLFYIQMEAPLAERGIYILRLLAIAEQKWRDANATAQLAEIFAFKAFLTRQEGNILQAMTWAKQALAWLPPENYTWRTIALSAVGVGELYEGNLAQSRTIFLETLLLNEQHRNFTSARANRGMLSLISYEQGELTSCAEQNRSMQTEARAQKDEADIAHSQLGLAKILYQWNDPEARQAAEEAFAIGERMGREDFQGQAVVWLALLDSASGQGEQAQQRLLTWLTGRPVPVIPASYQLHRHVQATLVHLQLASGNIMAAVRWFESIEQSTEVLPQVQRWREQILRARLLLVQREVNSAIELLKMLHAAMKKTGHFFLQMHVQAVLVLAYVRQGSQEQAQHQLLDLLKATQSEHFMRLYLDEGEDMLDLLYSLLPRIRDKTLLAYVRRILDAATTTTEYTQNIGKQDASPMLLDPLSAQEQRVLRLLAEGNTNAAIARKLVVSVNTVRTQVQSIYRKLNVNNRVEASDVARKLELV